MVGGRLLVTLSLGLVFIVVCQGQDPPAFQGRKDWTLSIKTGARWYAGTNANIFVKLFGTKGETSRKALNNGDKDAFSRGKLSTFKVKARDIGELQRVTVINDNSGPAPGWFLKKFTVTDPAGNQFDFKASEWLASDSKLKRVFSNPTKKMVSQPAPAVAAPTTSSATETTPAPTTAPPTTNAPTANAPTTNAPTTNAPATNAPATNAPATNAPTTSAPSTNAPATNAPSTNAPATKAPPTPGATPGATSAKAPATTPSAATQPPTTNAATKAPPLPPKQPQTTLPKAPAPMPPPGANHAVIAPKKPPNPPAPASQQPAAIALPSSSGNHMAAAKVPPPPPKQPQTTLPKAPAAAKAPPPPPKQPQTTLPKAPAKPAQAPKPAAISLPQPPHIGATPKAAPSTAAPTSAAPGSTAAPASSGTTQGVATNGPTVATTPKPNGGTGMIQYPLLTSMNSVRLIHGAGPLVTDETITKKAQEWANKIAASDKEGIDTDSPYGALICSRVDPIQDLDLAKQCVGQWYKTAKDYDWAEPVVPGKAGSFVQLIWKSGRRVGIAKARSPSGKFYVVAYIDPPSSEQNMKDNVGSVKDLVEPSENGECPADFVRNERSCFFHQQTPLTWENAIAQCAQKGASLASVQTKEQNTFVSGLIGGKEAWIGFHDHQTESRYTWVNGAPVNFHEFLPSEPTGVGEDCVAMETRAEGTGWADRKCTDKIPSVCMMPVRGNLTYKITVHVQKDNITQGQGQGQAQGQGQGQAQAVARDGTPQNLAELVKKVIKMPYTQAFSEGPGGGPEFVGESVNTNPDGSSDVAVFQKHNPKDDPNVGLVLAGYLENNQHRLSPKSKHNATLSSVELVNGGDGLCVSQCFTACSSQCNPVCCTGTTTFGAAAFPAPMIPATPMMMPQAPMTQQMAGNQIPYHAGYPAPYVSSYRAPQAFPQAFARPMGAYPQQPQQQLPLYQAPARPVANFAAYSISNQAPVMAPPPYQAPETVGCVRGCRQAHHCPSYCPKKCCHH
ncbi:uncharacterized protein LOC116609466 isoform X4 [Nematostella vectensis]|uniref:uncharacterized protein LOC116609466 isoform X4 n=1 Tax=Nematostella vectensis TaxID=45351 RepID=UPI002076F860|nr:uncharacterized protein LOC116609466 isoform X4 [Nematostella vectensis]